MWCSLWPLLFRIEGNAVISKLLPEYPYAFIVNRDIIRCEILRLKKSWGIITEMWQFTNLVAYTIFIQRIVQFLSQILAGVTSFYLRKSHEIGTKLPFLCNPVCRDCKIRRHDFWCPSVECERDATRSILWGRIRYKLMVCQDLAVRTCNSFARSAWIATARSKTSSVILVRCWMSESFVLLRPLYNRSSRNESRSTIDRACGVWDSITAVLINQYAYLVCFNNKANNALLKPIFRPLFLLRNGLCETKNRLLPSTYEKIRNIIRRWSVMNALLSAIKFLIQPINLFLRHTSLLHFYFRFYAFLSVHIIMVHTHPTNMCAHRGIIPLKQSLQLCILDRIASFLVTGTIQVSY